MTDEQKTDDLHAALGRAVIAWNNLEAGFHLIIYRLAGGTKDVDILTAHMTSATALDALQTLTNEFATDELQPALLHLHAFLTRLRVYRNSYLHGIRLIAFTPEGDAIGMSQSTKAKGRLHVSQESVTTEMLNQFVSWCADATKLASSITSALYGYSPNPGALQPLTLQEMPPLPQTKSRTHP